MSRHELTPRPERRHEVFSAVIGWDRALNTFFAQAMKRRHVVAVWRGAKINELRTAREAIDVIAPFALIPEGLEAQLEADRAADCGPDGPVQALLKREGVIR